MNPFISFIAQFISRLFSGKPKFFTIIQLIAGVLAAANVALSALVSGGTIAGDNKVVAFLTSGITFAVSLTAAIMAQLPVKSSSPIAK